MWRRTARAGAVVALLTCLVGGGAGIAPAQWETVGKVLSLPERPGPHWFWLSDVLLHRTALFDGDTGELLGAISSGTAGVGFVIAPLFAPDHHEIYLAETYYARGVRGERTDVVTVYDGRTLKPLGEISIPPRRGGESTSAGRPRRRSGTTGDSWPCSTSRPRPRSRSST